jgi:hypothetical protein
LQEKGVTVKKVKRKGANVKRLVLAGLVVVMVMVAAASMTSAAPMRKGSSRELAVFDPYGLRTVAVSDGSSIGVARGSVRLVSRPTIRVPYRAPLRSAFRPIW